MTPNISIVIPTLQEGQVLARSLKQFTPEIRHRFGVEVIVSDGGSADETLAIARQYADKVVEAKQGAHQNIAVGRNAGASVAEGSVIIFLDADVLIEDVDHFFNTIVLKMKNKNIAALTCNVRVYPADEKIPDLVFHQLYNNYFSLLNVIGIGMGRGECQVMRKSLFNEVGRYNETMPAAEDFDLFNRLKKRGRVFFAHSLTVRESPRRFRKQGYLYVSWLWAMNALSVWLFGKSYVRQWKAVR